MNEKNKLDVKADSSTILSGWAINSSLGTVWDDIFLEIDGKFYAAEKSERQDVADTIGNEIYTYCGFQFTLDSELLQTIDSIRFICVNYSSQTYYVEQIEISVSE